MNGDANYLVEQNAPRLLYIDLFCGAGGTSTGVEMAFHKGRKCAKVIACVNHDKNAIASHSANHPDALHYEEDIRTLDLAPVVAYVKMMRKRYPNALLVLWASLECVNFSRAKGGQSRDADSRTLAEHLYRYILALNPDIIQIENVEEFMEWGPLEIKIKKDKDGYEYCPLTIRKTGKGKDRKIIISPVYVPIKELRGVDYEKWVRAVKSYGYEFEHRILNAADFGAFTSRKRFFGQFSRPGLKIVWPKPTHAKNASKKLLRPLKKWNPVSKVLDFSDEGTSIFTRDTPLVENSLTRIYAGLIKFVAGGKDKFLVKYNSMHKNGDYNAPGVDEPCPVVTTQNRLGIASIKFLSKYFSGDPYSKNISVDGPAGSIKCIDNHSLISTFLNCYYSGGGQLHSIEAPSPTLRTKDVLSIVKCKQFIDQQYGQSKPASINKPIGCLTTNPKYALCQPFFANYYSGGGQITPVNEPCPAITTNPKQRLVICKRWIMDTNYNNVGSSIDSPAPVITANRKWHYLLNPQYYSKGGDIEKPCFTLIARMDKTPPYLISAESGQVAIVIYETDSLMTKKIKEFMAMYGILDIKMRMLKIPELKKIMGFPVDYVLKGSQAEQKKYIGNAVEVNMAKALCLALCEQIPSICQLKIAI
jgi:DNA (cytosine-5)-methyltransferase 1